MFPETAGKTLEEVESMFVAGERPWKTKVQYGRIRAVEQGQVDPEKAAYLAQEDVGAAPSQAQKEEV